ncbi:MAG: hypothetical protein ACRDD1_21135, partial [Planctomycetia bacterium]
MPFPRPAAVSKAADRRLLRLECLEDRSVPAALIVNTLSDATADDGKLSLREAIAAVNAGSAAGLDVGAQTQIGGPPFGTEDLINFDVFVFAGAQTITLNAALPTLTTAMTIDGPGADRLTIARNAAAGDFRLIT